MKQKTVLVHRTSEYSDHAFFAEGAPRIGIKVDMILPGALYEELGKPSTLRVTMRVEPESS